MYLSVSVHVCGHPDHSASCERVHASWAPLSNPTPSGPKHNHTHKLNLEGSDPKTLVSSLSLSFPKTIQHLAPGSEVEGQMLTEEHESTL